MSNPIFSDFAASVKNIMSDLHPEFISDVNDKGEDMIVMTVSNKNAPYWGISYEAGIGKNGKIIGSLWFGQCEIAGFMSGDTVADAIRSITASEIVCVVRYQNIDDWQDRHPSGMQRVFQIIEGATDDDSVAYETFRKKLNHSPSFWDVINRKNIGVFEIGRWGGVEIVQRDKSVKK